MDVFAMLGQHKIPQNTAFVGGRPFSITIKVLFLATATLMACSAAANTSKWVELLRGHELSDYWETKGNWTVSDEGVATLIPRPGEQGWDRFDAYLWSRREFADFEIEFEYKLQPHGNSGFYFHVGDKASPVTTGVEVQIFDSFTKPAESVLTDHDSGGIIPQIPPTRNASRAAGEWNRFHILVQDGVLKVTLNGQVVNEVKLDHPSIVDRPDSGYIGFQDHGLPLAIRNVRIRELASAAQH